MERNSPLSLYISLNKYSFVKKILLTIPKEKECDSLTKKKECDSSTNFKGMNCHLLDNSQVTHQLVAVKLRVNPQLDFYMSN